MCLVVLDVYVYNVLLGAGQTETINYYQTTACTRCKTEAFLVSNADGLGSRCTPTRAS